MRSVFQVPRATTVIIFLGAINNSERQAGGLLNIYVPFVDSERLQVFDTDRSHGLWLGAGAEAKHRCVTQITWPLPLLLKCLPIELPICVWTQPPDCVTKSPLWPQQFIRPSTEDKREGSGARLTGFKSSLHCWLAAAFLTVKWDETWHLLIKL